MNYFIYNYNNDNEELFTKIARYHIEFEKIHPFEDGNGRTGRLLLNFLISRLIDIYYHHIHRLL